MLVKVEDENISKMQEHFFTDEFPDNFGQSSTQTIKEQGPSRLFICGTNAYNPRCRYYKLLQTPDNDVNGKINSSIVFEKEVSGKGFCPYDPKHNSTFIYAGKCQNIYAKIKNGIFTALYISIAIFDI